MPLLEKSKSIIVTVECIACSSKLIIMYKLLLSFFLSSVSILPVLGMSETSLKVKVQHDGYIHRGACPADCPQRYYKVSP